MPEMWAKCPFCRTVFEVDEDAPQILIKGHRRFVCGKCRTPPQEAHPSNENGKPKGTPLRRRRAARINSFADAAGKWLPERSAGGKGKLLSRSPYPSA
jgi:hypothetical protein